MLAAGAQGVPGHSAVPSRQGEIAVLRWLDVAAEMAVVIALLVELGLVIANVADRLFFAHSFLWTDEAARLESIARGDTASKWLPAALRAAGVLKEGETL